MIFKFLFTFKQEMSYLEYCKSIAYTILCKFVYNKKREFLIKKEFIFFFFLCDFPFSVSKVIFFEIQLIFQFIYSKTVSKLNSKTMTIFNF